MSIARNFARGKYDFYIGYFLAVIVTEIVHHC